MWVSLGLACYDHFQTTDNSTQNDWKPSRKVTLGDFKWAHIKMITVVFASVIEKDYRPQMTGNHQGKWLSCYLTHKNMELSATTPQNPRDCFALGKLWIYTLYPADTPKHNLLILWILSNVDFLASGSEPLAINFPMKSSQRQSPFPSLTSFPSIYAQLVSKSSWWRWTRTPAPFLPHFISLARFILCFYRIYGKIRGFSKTVNLRNSSTAYHRNTFHTAVCKKSALRFMFLFLIFNIL